MHIRDLPAATRMQRAMSAVVTSQPFFGVILLHSKLVEDASVETMAVDGRHLFYAPAFVEGLGEAELFGVLVHEALHLALGHHVRRGARDPGKWNEACDFAINPLVQAAGFKLPAGGLLDPAFAGMSAEAIYAARAPVPQPPQPGGGDSGKGAGDKGAPQPAPGASGQPDASGAPSTGTPSPGKAPDPARCGGVIDAAPDAAGLEQARGEHEAMMRQAVAIEAKRAGEVSGAAAAIRAELDRPRVAWWDVLAQFIDDAAVHETNWSRPDRRFLAHGFYVPSHTPDAVSCLALCCDTSGSVLKAVSAFASEIRGILDMGRVQRVTVIYCDSRVRGVEHFEAGDIVELNPQGGGGTRFDVAFEHVAEHVPDAAAIVYLTDLDSRHFGPPPAVPVLWCVTGNRTAAPFGDVIPVDPFA